MTGASKRVENSSEWKWLVLLLLAAIFIVGLPAGSSFGSDDVWSLHAVGHTHAQMVAILKADIHPPLYYELLFWWVRAFGVSEVAVRGLSIALFLLSTMAVYWWARKLLGAAGALMAAAVYMTSPLAMMAAGLARMYALLSLLSILSTALYWMCFVEDQPSQRRLIGLIVVNALGAFTQIWFFFLLFAEGLHFVIFVKRRWLRFTASYGAALLPYAVLWLPDLLRQMKKSNEAVAWIPKPDIGEIGSTVFMYAGAALIFLPFLIFKFIRERRRLPDWTLGVAFLLAATLVVPFSLSFVKPVFYPRFTIIGLHLFAVLVAGIAVRTVNWQFPALLSAVVAAGVIYGVVAPGICDARWGAEFLAEQAGPTDTAVFTSLSREPIDYYLHRMAGAPLVPETSFPADIDSHPGYEGNLLAPERLRKMEAEADALVDHLRSRPGRVLFFHGFRPEVDAILQTRLDRQFHLLKSQSVECHAMHCYYDTVSVYEGSGKGSAIDIPAGYGNRGSQESEARMAAAYAPRSRLTSCNVAECFSTSP